MFCTYKHQQCSSAGFQNFNSSRSGIRKKSEKFEPNVAYLQGQLVLKSTDLIISSFRIYKYFCTLFFVVLVDSAICNYSRTTEASWLDPKFCAAQNQILIPSKSMKMYANLNFFQKIWFSNAKAQTRDTQWQNLSRWYNLKYVLQMIFFRSAQSAKIFGILKRGSYWVSVVHVPIQPSVWLDGLAVPFYKRKKDEKIWQKNEVPSLQRK